MYVCLDLCQESITLGYRIFLNFCIEHYLSHYGGYFNKCL